MPKDKIYSAKNVIANFINNNKIQPFQQKIIQKPKHFQVTEIIGVFIVDFLLKLLKLTISHVI